MPPTIQSTEFGNITVDDEVYQHDVVIRLSGKVTYVKCGPQIDPDSSA